LDQDFKKVQTSFVKKMDLNRKYDLTI